MADPAQLFVGSWGGVRVWMSRVSTDHGRMQVLHLAARGDRQLATQDRGRNPHVTRCSLLFDDGMIGETKSGFERYHEFKALKDSGIPQVFTHPLDGSFLAKIGDFNVEVDAHSVISGDCEFIADEEIRPVSVSGAGTTVGGGADAVTAAADAVDDELAAVGLESDVPARAREATDAWVAAEELSPRQVYVDVAELTQRQQDAIASQGLETDLGYWSSFKASIMLAESVRAAGEAATAEVAQVFTMRIMVPTALLSLCASIYGGTDAEPRRRQVMELNDIPTPGWIPAGSELVMPAPAAAPRSR